MDRSGRRWEADWDPYRARFPVAAWANRGWMIAERWLRRLAAASCSFLGADARDINLAGQVREAPRTL